MSDQCFASDSSSRCLNLEQVSNAAAQQYKRARIVSTISVIAAFLEPSDIMTRLARRMANIAQQEDINFLLTNRIPRRLATRFFGWFSQIEHPLVRDLSIGVWRLFADLDLSDASETRFRSLHDCFIRRLKEGARPIDPIPICWSVRATRSSAHPGRWKAPRSLQIKGFPLSACETCSSTTNMPLSIGTVAT